MPLVNETELVCPVCQGTDKLPVCCGRTMENDGNEFFCQTCGKEIAYPQCCNTRMLIKKRVRDIKKQIFGQL